MYVIYSLFWNGYIGSRMEDGSKLYYVDVRDVPKYTTFEEAQIEARRLLSSEHKILSYKEALAKEFLKKI